MLSDTDPVEQYCLNHSTQPSALCDELLKYTKAHVPMATMLIGPSVAGLLQFLIRLGGVKRVLEIGCFTGYSALAMAEALPVEGQITSLDINPDTAKIAQEFWNKSTVGSKIKLVLGPAIETLSRLEAPFDFILIDADKTNYISYLNRSLELLSPKGLIVLDNCLWSNRVLDLEDKSPETEALRKVATFLKSRQDLRSVLLPVRDGLYLVQKI